MLFSPEWIKDVVGNNYIAIKVWHTIVSPYIQTLREIIDTQEEYDKLVKNQRQRDDDKYHMTILNVMEIDQLIKKYGIVKATSIFDSIIQQKITDIEFGGIGKAEKSGSVAYFIIVNSSTLQGIRDKYELTHRDLHVTLGFDPKDVHGVSKNIPIKEMTPFLKLFKKLFYNDPSLGDLKLVENFDLDFDIKPIELTERYIKVVCGHYYVVISSIDDPNPKLWVTAQWLVGNDNVEDTLSDAHIRKFIKNYEQ